MSKEQKTKHELIPFVFEIEYPVLASKKSSHLIPDTSKLSLVAVGQKLYVFTWMFFQVMHMQLGKTTLHLLLQRRKLVQPGNEYNFQDQLKEVSEDCPYFELIMI